MTRSGRGRAGRARDVPSRLRHHRRRRGRRQEADPDERAGRPLAPLPARGRAPRRPGDARAIRARADPRTDVQRLLRRVDVRPAADLSARFPAEHACRLRLHLAGGAIARRRKVRLRGLPDPPDELGAGTGEVRAARRADGRGRALAAELAGVVAALDELEDARPDRAARASERTRDDERSSSMTAQLETTRPSARSRFCA